MKVNREIVVEAGLNLLNEVGLEQLTLRRLAKNLKIQAPTLYWHFKSKEELIDAMATLVLTKVLPDSYLRRTQAIGKPGSTPLVRDYAERCSSIETAPVWSLDLASRIPSTWRPPSALEGAWWTLAFRFDKR